MLERFRNETARSLAASELADEEERHVAKLHFVACFDCKRSDVFCLVLRYKIGDAFGDLVALLIERVFPEQAGQDGTPEFQPRIDVLGHCPFVSSRREKTLPYIEFCHRTTLLSAGALRSGHCSERQDSVG